MKFGLMLCVIILYIREVEEKYDGILYCFMKKSSRRLEGCMKTTTTAEASDTYWPSHIRGYIVDQQLYSTNTYLLLWHFLDCNT